MEKLNKEQLEAVTYKNGPLLIVAGAGTGKTTVITQKIAWLIEQGFAKTDEILALTFTEKAAGEMEERIDRLLPMGYLDLWVSTFHSFCERILKENGLDIGLPTDFKLLNSSEQWMLVKKNLHRFNLYYYQPLGNQTKFIHALLKHFSRAKDENISPKEYLKYAENLKINLDRMESGAVSAKKSKNKSEIDEIEEQEIIKINEVADAYHTYQQLLLENSYLDFGDLINYTLKLFQKRPGILKKYREQFKYILVDEFQDTNWAQYELIKILASPKNNLTVVCDDDQSIFRFRGASMSNILQFKKDYPKSKNIVLINNYRNKQNILDASYEFIKLNNPNRLEVQLKEKLNKKLIANNKGDGKIECIKGESIEDENEKVIKKIVQLKNNDEKSNWNDFAILIRSNNMANSFMFLLERFEIPYIFLASRGLYSKSIILDIIAYLKLLDDYHESTAVFRILSLQIFAFSSTELTNLNYWATRKSVSLYEILKQAKRFNFSQETLDKINRILGLVEKHTNFAREKSVGEVVLKFLEDSGYLKYLAELKEQKAKEEFSYLNQFYKKIKTFEQNSDDKKAKDFLNELEMEIESGEQGGLAPDYESGPEALKILTVHSAKGLEFKYVFIVNLVDKRFPSVGRKEQIALPDDLIKEILPEGDIHIEEERRLFYVAMTRAKKGLFFSWGEDYGGIVKKKPSRFLIELEMAKKEHPPAGGKKRKTDFELNAFIPKINNNIQDEKIKYSLPAYFSFSKLEAYDNCPYQYYLTYVLNIPKKGKAQFSFGKTIHSVLQKIMELFLSKSQGKQSDLFSQNNKIIKKFGEVISLNEMLDIYKNLWIDDWYDDEKSRKEYFKKGKEILSNFHSKHKDKIIEPLFLEKDFKYKISSENFFRLKGAIDRIDKFEDGIKIIDYKTGKPKEKLSFKEKKQLLTYQLIFSDGTILKKPIKQLSYYYLENNSEVEFLGTEKELEKTKENIIKTIEKIKQNDFTPNPGMLCQYCDFNKICDFKKNN